MENLGLGILCWRGYASLVASLESYKKNGFLELFNERVIYFQEIDDEAKNIAKQYGLKAYGNESNVGIYGGFKGLASNIRSPYILFVENDQKLVVEKQDAEKQLKYGVDFLQTGQANLVQCRWRNPSNKIDFETSRLRMFHPEKSASKVEKARAFIRRTLRPGKAAKFAGPACYLMENPEHHFKDVTRHAKSDFLFTPSKNRDWLNQNFLIRKDFFENVILSYVENLDEKTLPKKFFVNGYKSLERGLLYKKWWHKQPFTVAMAPGLFLHDRKEYRGY